MTVPAFFIPTIALHTPYWFFSGGLREGITLEKIFRFITGCDSEPVVGFTIRPSVEYCEMESFLPRSSTCTNTLYLPLPMGEGLVKHLPPKPELYSKYDIAFVNDYFGLT